MNYNNIDGENDSLRLEAVMTCVGFDDILDITLEVNHPHFDSLIVVTSFEDKATQAVARKHGAFCVQTDLFKKNERNFNKGAAINAGFNYFQYYGWRMHMDADIILPDNFRRVIFNHTSLHKDHIYGADRIDVIGVEGINAVESVQHRHSCFVIPGVDAPISPRYVDKLYGYCPLGFFQLWHAKNHKQYPYSLGTAAHDDIMFSSLWPTAYRTHLPSVVAYHLCTKKPTLGENWEGRRQQPRLEKK